jgi:hypothetical protein
MIRLNNELVDCSFKELYTYLRIGVSLGVAYTCISRVFGKCACYVQPHRKRCLDSWHDNKTTRLGTTSNVKSFNNYQSTLFISQCARSRTYDLSTLQFAITVLSRDTKGRGRSEIDDPLIVGTSR